MSKETINISLGRHESFYIRENWLRKGIVKVKESKQIFTESKKNKNIDLVEEFGIGSNMVTALKYWLKTSGLIKENKAYNEFGYITTELCDKIFEFDPYFEYDGTYAVLHYNICENIDTATTWNWFFYHFNKREFTRSSFINHYQAYLKNIYNYEPSEKMLEKEFGCFIKTYTESKISIKENNYEDKINSPFSCLKLIKTKFNNDINREVYIKNYSEEKFIDPEIVGYIILKDHFSKKFHSHQIKLDEALSLISNLYNLEYSNVIDSIEKLCKDNRFKGNFILTQKADINNLSVNIEKPYDMILDLLAKYYERVKE